ncbi:Protein kinase domain-containing protein [Aphelenchoides besseyi]|nr:Protein kinase domain-containing protein [Aphelenchoides besseyi]KAI6216370.1 Protein kinase domain-containing protein [Aphelenchoides besseyi]
MQHTVHDYPAVEMPSEKPCTLKMCKLRLHSSGVFSNVYRGLLLEPKPQREIAVKKTWPDGGQDANKNYEVLMLLELSKEKHLNIVQVLFTFKTRAPDGRTCESMVFDFMPSTLHSAVKSLGGRHPNTTDIKIYTWQLFNGLHYLFKAGFKKICHRDIKPQNILIDPDNGVLKIGDFGSAKVMKANAQSTAYQVTRFYRPPELLMNATLYSPLVDVWSGGCVLGEMFRGTVLFPGRDSKHQLLLIVSTLGTPDPTEIQAMRAADQWDGPPMAPRGFSRLLPHCPRESMDFLQRILVYTPNKRLCGVGLLTDPYFSDLFIPNKKRQNGRLVSDIPSFKDMMDFGPKYHSTQRKRAKITTSAESTVQPSMKSAEASRLSQEQAQPKNSQETTRKKGANRTNVTTTTTTTITNERPISGDKRSRENIGSRETITAIRRTSKESLVKKSK